VNRITDLKRASKGESKKKYCTGKISKEFFAGDNAKHAHLAGDNDL
jgi:hypothetical protein